MVSSALWNQVAALPLRDQLELAGRIHAQIPTPPEELLPSTWDGLGDLLARSEASERDHPELVVSVNEAIARERAKYKL
ncbi:MAG: hypothetical protein FWF02_15075 [Micrococcales bacterium]|nr:hypothetical protein [Micrococcales bacterium]MCL2669002.1 hypothetical protein [Micrococcales bacterium]